MNILPKKRWHVRTKDNIARVRRDEKEAFEQERIRQEKLELAESESRINFLRRQSGIPERKTTETETNTQETENDVASSEQFNLFADYKSHIKTTNKELEKEKKEEQEKYEKQIGYLTYLGQDTNEALKLRSWYEVAPKRAKVGDNNATENDMKNKYTHDPLTLIKALLPPEKQVPLRSDTKKSKLTHTPANAEVAIAAADITNHSAKTERALNTKKHKKEKHKKKDKHNQKRSKKRQHKEKQLVLEEEMHRINRDKLEKLRKERLRREASERARQEALLAPKETNAQEKNLKTPSATPRIVQKYNSQFNPDLAKQNML